MFSSFWTGKDEWAGFRVASSVPNGFGPAALYQIRVAAGGLSDAHVQQQLADRCGTRETEMA
ncbi:unnamed protein product, partial [Iphiclides podalirius]